MNSAETSHAVDHADGSTSPLSLNSPTATNDPDAPLLAVRVEPAAKTPLLSVHEEAEHLYPAVIEWARPCESVGVTGSFNNWGSQILLKRVKVEDGAPLFRVKLWLPVGTHLFKFCVDGAWQYDPEVTFAPDEYGNLNNFIKIAPARDPQTLDKPLQRAIRTILRDASEGLPVMNPVASEELMKLRLQTSPVLRPQRSPTSKTPSHHPRHDSRSDPTPRSTPAPLTAPRQPQETEDSEYGIDVNERRMSSHNLLANKPRSRAGTLTRSKSEESLSHAASSNNLLTADTVSTPKYTNYMDDVIANSVLLAATTQHFGGDLVTHEHNMRAQLGGHRSVLVRGPHTAQTTPSPQRSGGKLIIFLVGLPGRGKTYIGHILARHLTWMGHQSRTFNTGEYRRRLVGSNVNHAFWDPFNEESFQIRTELSRKCLEDSIAALESNDCDCVIFDATNVTRKRRQMLANEVHQRYKCEMMFIESVCDDPDLIASSINEMKLNSADYAGQTMEEAAEDYNNRINHYQSLYEPLAADLEGAPFIKIIDVGRQIFCNQVYGYLQSRIMFLMANLNLKPRPIWLSRHGESMYNTQKRIGGDAPLSPHGVQYAEQLDRFIDAYYPTPDTELAVWTSTMLRTGMTVERIAARGRSIVKWKQLDEIDAGICDGMTYEQVAEEMPEEYLARKNNKLHYRYPRGESYQDVIHRLEPVITELMRMDQPVLIVAHQAILRVLYAYLTNKSPHECPTLNIPLHVVIQVTPKAYKCEEVWHRPM
ncbi:6-phosphofructo-2-kinase/fructose-2,6-bisphosphatase [Phytophthora fragariae]|uniref:6-phosphofructo-2-kinase/fructose-2, 6-bisphosphatase n=1 Tax=Phytophthora fragariae TaxID=53985 RepID=A0A6A3UMP8_9STRA|nr:6-phosphofructo-2-kinase/fructose-2,6-bisphosphatase [Phytophthora fragariae]KAE9026170.1 6-phosphofructo-2-kinase/fructose-2,6-bisphosphatase [Phytophthora fragariae]KAE9132497.1 6-phosphofructo-2-kinase/fructose-2,6-bisphosphatase [Phytophthora fragariae]KAE9137378.1 6-phosphofructo-2-kinase/fructose-2,6-bisphosphatase [Phytophthora fragariae]KAE9153022.1 6-phosphofructo-2-kinase/fructose-2,6-bisphosphatase [Phytophthora fragariae]